MTQSEPKAPSPEQKPGAGGGPVTAVVRGGLRQWPLALGLGLVLAAAGGGGYFAATPPKLTVGATLRVDPADANLLSDRGISRDREEEYRKTQMALLRSRKVLGEALKDRAAADTVLLRSKADPVGWLETDLKVVPLEGGFIRVALTGRSADEAAAVLNAVTAAYTRVVVDGEKDERMRTINELDQVLVAVDDRVRVQREVIRGLSQQLRGGDPQALSLRQKSAIELAVSLSQELGRLDGEIRRTKAELAVLKTRAESAKTAPLPEALLAEAIDADPTVRAAAEKVAEGRNLLELTTRAAAPTATALGGLRRDVEAAEKALADTHQRRREPVAARLRDTVARQAAAQEQECRAKLEVLQRQRDELSPEVTRQHQQADKIGVDSFDLELKRMETAEAESIGKRLRAEKERLDIEVRTFRRRVNVFSPADPAEARISTSRYAAAAALAAAGFAAGFVLVGFGESRRRRLFEPAEVSRALEVRTVGSIPYAVGPARAAVFDLWEGGHGLPGVLVAEAVNDLRAMLLCGELAGRAKVVAVTSASQGEGKTTLASLLAASAAQTGKRVLLVDGDVRNPRVHERFGLATGPGLAAALAGDAKPPACVIPVPGTTLSVLPAGWAARSAARNLTGDRVRGVLADLRETFDLIIVDTSPLLPVPDGVVVSKAADATILVVRSGESREPEVREACERLAAVRANLVGTVVNGLPLPKSRLRYPYAGRTAADEPAWAVEDSSPTGVQ